MLEQDLLTVEQHHCLSHIDSNKDFSYLNFAIPVFPFLDTGIVFKTEIKMSVKKIICILLFFIGLPVISAQEKIKLKEPKSTVLIVYGSDSCHHCIDTKLFLKNNSINFVFYDIDKDPVALKEMLGKLEKANISTANLGIPVVDKQGQFIINNGNFEDFLNKLKDDIQK